MNTVQVKVSHRVVTAALEIKPDYDTNAAHLSRLLELGIDTALSLGKPAAPQGGTVLPSKAVNKEKDVEIALQAEEAHIPIKELKKVKDPFSTKTIASELIPEELEGVADLFCEWWAVRAKGATFTKSVAKREFKKLLAWSPEDRTKALQSAIASGWKQLYEPKPDKPAQGHYGASETPHPASKVFKASDLDWPGPAHPLMEALTSESPF